MEISSEQQTIVVPAGSTFSQLWSWYPQAVWVSDFWYKIWLKLHTPEHDLQAGTYIVPAHSTLSELVHVHLATPVHNDREITILPGWNIFQIQQYLQGIGIDTSSFEGRLKALQDELSQEYPYLWDIDSFEGLLSPDTYRVHIDASLEDVIRRMFITFDERIYSHLEHREDWYDVIILASIVEQEEKNPTNKPLVAGILQNRLTLGMPLGADVTVCYEQKEQKHTCQEFVNAYYAKSMTERKRLGYAYDTRHTAGLIPTPVGSISLDTLEATLSPKSSDYLFYLHDPEGNIHPAITNKQHAYNKSVHLR